MSCYDSAEPVEFKPVEFADGMPQFASLVHMRGGALACRIMQIAFTHGAHVAGGFARVVLTPRPETPDPLGSLTVVVEEYMRRNGDIDIFFPDAPALAAFWNDYEYDAVLRSAKLSRVTMPTGMAVEIALHGTRIQVITRFVGPIEEQLRRFDIYNGMVAFNDKGGLVPTEWMALEEHKLLHVTNWSSIFVIHRLAKWQHKQGYLGLTPKTASEIGTVALDIIQKLKDKPHKNPWGGELTHNDVAAKLKRFLPHLTAEQLLLISSIQPIDAYDGAFGILRRRAMRNDLNIVVEVVH